MGRPRIVGALGAFDPGVVAHLLAREPGLRPVVEEADCVLLASADLAPYRSDEGVRAWSFSGHTPPRGAKWCDAALSHDSPGLALEPDQVVLHAGALGSIDLFVREVGAATWFASRMEDLLDVTDGRLSVDWDAWACILVLNYPVGDATPFREVRRLQGGETRQLDRRVRRVRPGRWDPPWVGREAADPDAGDPEHVADAVRTAVGRLPAGPFAVPLSGGIDSRLAALALRDAGRSYSVWTTEKDDGKDDIGIATELASMLGLPLRVVEPEPEQLVTAALETFDRVDFMVPLHAWIQPLARELERTGRDVVDALLAANVLKGAILERRRTTDEPAADWRVEAWETLVRQDSDGSVLGDAATRWAFDTARRAWDAAIERYRGDPHESFLSLLTTRTLRGVASLPVWMYGPESLVHMPFTDPGFIVAGLGAGRRRRAHDGFYFEVLRQFDPDIAGLRTTHDDSGRLETHRYLRATTPYRMWVADRLEDIDELPGLVSARLTRYLRLGRLDAPPTRVQALRGIGQRPLPKAIGSRRMARTVRRSMPAVQLGLWLRRHERRLGHIDPPWERA